MNAKSVRIEAGEVFIPEAAEWLGDFQAEICVFPNGSHDDQVDALSQLLWWVDEGRIPRWRSGTF